MNEELKNKTNKPIDLLQFSLRGALFGLIPIFFLGSLVGLCRYYKIPSFLISIMLVFFNPFGGCLLGFAIGLIKKNRSLGLRKPLFISPFLGLIIGVILCLIFTQINPCADLGCMIDSVIIAFIVTVCVILGFVVGLIIYWIKIKKYE